ncbi:MAG: hypothetical protein KIT81_07115 [Alphaproteobacteria bacterium]|nr:hypothetical protein [Alphaproteobacteria bacterium]
MPDFWLSSGYHLLDRDPAGQLLVTADFLRAYLGRPELMPPPEACAAERGLHAALLDDPARAVAAGDVAELADPDAAENYRVFLAFRDLLLAARTVEAGYQALFRPGAPRVPALFIDHLSAVILRHLLDGTPDAQRARAAELFYRTQLVTIQEGAILLADEETVERLGRTGGFGALGNLLAEAGTRPRAVDMDVLTAENAESYWPRSDRHEMVLDLSFARPGQDALARVMERFVRHLTGVDIGIQPVQRIRDERWVWHTGLDAEASAVMNALYRGEEVEEARLARILALFRLEFRDTSSMRADLAGRPVYLGLAMDGASRLRMKPQNLLMNLPFKQRS